MVEEILKDVLADTKPEHMSMDEAVEGEALYSWLIMRDFWREMWRMEMWIWLVNKMVEHNLNDGLRWCCSKCGNTSAVKKASIFSGRNIDMRVQIRMYKWWVDDRTTSACETAVGKSQATV